MINGVGNSLLIQNGATGKPVRTEPHFNPQAEVRIAQNQNRGVERQQIVERTQQRVNVERSEKIRVNQEPPASQLRDVNAERNRIEARASISPQNFQPQARPPQVVQEAPQAQTSEASQPIARKEAPPQTQPEPRLAPRTDTTTQPTPRPTQRGPVARSEDFAREEAQQSFSSEAKTNEVQAEQRQRVVNTYNFAQFARDTQTAKTSFDAVA